MPCSKRAIQLNKVKEDWWGLSLAYVNLGGLYASQGQADSARWSYEQALNLADKINNDPLRLEALYGLALLAHKYANYRQALEDGKEALEIAERIDDPAQLVGILDILHRSAQALGYHVRAYKYLLQYTKAKERAFNQQKSQTIAKIEQKAALTSLKLQQELQQQKLESTFKIELSRQRQIQYMTAIGSVILLVVLLILYRSYHLIRIREQAITHLNQTLEQQVTERVGQLQDYAYMNAHKVRGPLARIQGLALLFATPNALNETEKKEMAGQILKEANALDEIIREINQQLSN